MTENVKLKKAYFEYFKCKTLLQFIFLVVFICQVLWRRDLQVVIQLIYSSRLAAVLTDRPSELQRPQTQYCDAGRVVTTTLHQGALGPGSVVMLALWLQQHSTRGRSAPAPLDSVSCEASSHFPLCTATIHTSRHANSNALTWNTKARTNCKCPCSFAITPIPVYSSVNDKPRCFSAPASPLKLTAKSPSRNDSPVELMSADQLSPEC